MTLTRLTRLTREVLLTFSAIVGALCVLLTALGFAFGVHPLMFKSGSMSPTINTGDIAFGRTVDASSVSKGDIVSLIAPSGERVTHRVIDNTGDGKNRKLTLKGDANQVIDPIAYDAVKVQKVFFHLPKLGYAVAWLSKAPGVYLVAGYVALMLLLIGRGGAPGDRSRGRRTDTDEPTAIEPDPLPVQVTPAMKARRRGPVVAIATSGVLTLLLAAGVTWAMPTWAAWVDPVAITGQSLTTGSWGALAAPVISCSKSGNNYTISWTAVPNASSYTVTWNDTSGHVSTQTVSSSPVVLNPVFGPNGGHPIFVTANNASGSSAPSNSITSC